jgi:hypothetical protein
VAIQQDCGQVNRTINSHSYYKQVDRSITSSKAVRVCYNISLPYTLIHIFKKASLRTFLPESNTAKDVHIASNPNDDYKMAVE